MTYATSPDDAHRQRGPQQPSKYPVAVGPAYQHYGEQPGWIYDPYSDTYRPHPDQQRAVLEAQGIDTSEPEPPSLVEQAAPLAIGAGALSLGNYIGKDPVGVFQGVKDVFGGLLGSSGSAPAQQALSAPEILSAGRLTPTFGDGLIGPPNAPPAAPGIGGFLGTAAPIAAVAYGLNAGKDFFTGEKLNTAQKVALALPTAGLSLFSDKLQDKFGLSHVSTKEQQQKNWGRLAEELVGTPSSSYVAAYQKHIDDPNNPEYWAPDHQAQWEAAGKPDPAKFRKENMMGKSIDESSGMDLAPGLGFFETFGNDWLDKYSEAQRIEIAGRAKEEGLLKSSRGDILVRDKDRVREIGTEVSAGGLIGPLTSERPIGFDEDPNNPGKYIRR